MKPVSEGKTSGSRPIQKRTRRAIAYWRDLLARFLRLRRPDLYLARLVGRLLSDRAYLATGYRLYFGVWPNYDQPRTLNECIHAYMLDCRDPVLKIAADKASTRAYVSQHVGAEYLVPCHGIWSRAEDVPLASLPRPCVLKPTVASGIVMFLRDGENVEEERARVAFRRWLRLDYSRMHREWSYSNAEQRIIAERMLLDPQGSPPPDYKAYVIGGKVRFLQVDRNRFARHTRNLYSCDWGLLPVRLTIENHEPDERPERLAEMIQLAERLARPFEFLRVDYYLIEGALYIGELTNTPGAGFERFIPESFAVELGSYWPRDTAVRASGSPRSKGGA